MKNRQKILFVVDSRFNDFLGKADNFPPFHLDNPHNLAVIMVQTIDGERVHT